MMQKTFWLLRNAYQLTSKCPTVLYAGTGMPTRQQSAVGINYCCSTVPQFIVCKAPALYCGETDLRAKQLDL